MSESADKYEIDLFTYVGATLGNALASELTLSEVMMAYTDSSNIEEFDAAVSALATLRWNFELKH